MKILFAEIHFEQNLANNKIHMYVFIPLKILENNLTLGLYAPFQYLIAARFDAVLEGRVKITDLCIGCGEVNIHAEHPLFEGGLCKECKVRLTS